jgi:hypothetical protein
VKLSTACTPADAATGGTPRLINKVLEITPKAIPSAPSISCATKPIAAKGRMSPHSKAVDQSPAPPSFRSNRLVCVRPPLAQSILLLIVPPG